MISLPAVLRTGAVAFFLVAALHLVLGLKADTMLGASLSADVLRDPVLDSQNRFYGASFALYGVMLVLCASDLDRYATVVRCTLWCFFVGGCARLVSIALNGWPSAPVIALLASELILPPFLIWWLARRPPAARPEFRAGRQESIPIGTPSQHSSTKESSRSTAGSGKRRLGDVATTAEIPP